MLCCCVVVSYVLRGCIALLVLFCLFWCVGVLVALVLILVMVLGLGVCCVVSVLVSRCSAMLW